MTTIKSTIYETEITDLYLSVVNTVYTFLKNTKSSSALLCIELANGYKVNFRVRKKMAIISESLIYFDIFDINYNSVYTHNMIILSEFTHLLWEFILERKILGEFYNKNEKI